MGPQLFNNTNTDVAARVRPGFGLEHPFMLFGSTGFSPILFTIFGTKCLVCFIGVFLNLVLSVVAYRTKYIYSKIVFCFTLFLFRALRGSCNIQIGLNGVSIALMEMSAFIPLYLTASGQNFLTLMPCGLIQAIPWFCTVFTNGNGLAIGVDRLLGVCFPIW